MNLWSKLFKDKLFLIGFIFIATLLIASLFHSYILGGTVRNTFFLYGENNELLTRAPIAPSWSILFGTDAMGYHMLDRIILGAKYTITFSILVAILRVFFSLLFGIIYSFYFKRFRHVIESIIDSFHYVPVSLLTYVMLFPVLAGINGSFIFTFPERIIIEGIVLTCLAVPVGSVLLGNEINLILNEDFIKGARTIGGNNLHIFKKHIWPHLAPRLAIIYCQQLISVLLVLSHLGLFKLFLGGTVFNESFIPDPPKSLSAEWSGIIGDSFRELYIHPWIPMTPIIFFGLTILAINFILEGYKNVLNQRTVKEKKWMKDELEDEVKDIDKKMDNNSFRFNNRGGERPI